jgi:hypothetical protein
MATTTNYSWTTPDDTDLVKDGAAAIRTLGSSVDTTTKALNPSTTLGDIEYRSSTANTNTRLGIGSTGNVLTVSGGVPAWVAPASGGMTLISTTTLTGASVTLSSIPQTYNDLRILVRSYRPATDAAWLYGQINEDSGANRHTDSFTSNNDVSGAVARSFNDVANVLGSQQDNGTDNAISIINFFDYTNTATWRLGFVWAVGNNGTTSTQANLMGRFLSYNQTNAITSLKLFPSSGNFTSGTVYLYGVK